ncbi:MAG TPA: histidine kinase [Polyangiaceae bacterium LLY-WYZ-15_(1-7)]|nr:hypothetical protein [Myxococcales bacterium]MAT26874.1 hypothetical protein [Sandaracinus sp.]HJL04513.1 histidine kinase [Polyangiaceae bacterium LLY-WYZ-15_(1-7)]HJL08525.1 histidine kinase [Polyangiaceae bacterium LLY-WYZ-15_(1-7)]HJL33155.1 histidine kinase [Polyangiaceae bacterium LLY-WYZ-15_(1-7)]
MDVRLIIIEIAEKIGLVMTAGLVSVLFPPLRNRLLGLGQPRDRFVALLLGYFLAMWGAKMGEWWLGHHVNIHTIGVMMAAMLGGARVGVLAGLLAGLFYVYRVEPSLGLLGVAATTLEGALAGWIVWKRPRWLRGGGVFLAAGGVQLSRFVFVGVALAIAGQSADFLAAWPAMLVQAAGVAVGITIFVFTTRVVLAREEAAVQLVEARAAADHLALEALRRRLEPHFLFNALNTLRATIRRDPPKARDLVSHLSDLYRYLLHHPEDAPLQSEVEHAIAYLAIERARLGEERLAVETEIEPEVQAAQVPALLLQPLVENAVKHGVAAHAGGGTVHIAARRERRKLRIEVVDTSDGEHLGVVSGGSGIALKTLRERLAKRFQGEARLELVPHERGMCARVTVPWPDVAPDAPGDDEERKRSAA